MQVDVLSVDLTDTVSIGIYDTSVIQELLSAFRIVLIRVVQLVITIGQGRGQYGEARCVQVSDGLGQSKCRLCIGRCPLGHGQL